MYLVQIFNVFSNNSIFIHSAQDQTFELVNWYSIVSHKYIENINYCTPNQTYMITLTYSHALTT